jgi:RNA polymerase sigma-70 factor, ECF subfamily
VEEPARRGAVAGEEEDRKSGSAGESSNGEWKQGPCFSNPEDTCRLTRIARQRLFEDLSPEMNHPPKPPAKADVPAPEAGIRPSGKRDGTFTEKARRNAEEHMSAKAQEVALDRVLIDRFRSGDSAAFEEMVSRHWDRIYGMVHQLLRNQQDAEEVTQDAFIRAHRGLANFRGDSSFSTWLYQIATNLARNRYWYWWRRKRDRTVSFDQPVGDDNDTPLSEVFVGESESPEDVTVTQELVDRIAVGMEKLSAKHREILILRNVKNLSYEEIAAILGISVGTVKSRIARARDSLREVIGGDDK